MPAPRALARALVLPFFLGPLARPCRADVRPSPLFGEGMVLQRDAPIPVWGTADPGEEVTVAIGERRAGAKADPRGRWSVRLEPLPAGSGLTIAFAGRNRIEIPGVRVGEVWVCSGQSNMEWPVEASGGADEAAATAEDPDLRLFTVPHRVSAEPEGALQGKWSGASRESVPAFSAVAHAFGRELRQALRVPVGLIQATWGGTPAESWTPGEALAAEAALAPVRARWAKALLDLPEASRRFEEETALWKEAAAKAKAEGKPEPRAPARPLGPDHPHVPSGLWNGMVAPLVPFAIRGAIWYQGESNASRAAEYEALFGAMIRAWRKAWGEGDFPFLYVQLANFRPGGREDGTSWAELREAQRRALALPGTAMAVAIDIGNPADIHPRNKREVGRRLARLASARVYGLGGPHSGPVVRGTVVEGDSLRVRFDLSGGALVARGPLAGFEVAGEDARFAAAEARIEGDSVWLRSAEVPRPVRARYAWRDDPPVSLFDEAGLPASPFRTGD